MICTFKLAITEPEMNEKNNYLALNCKYLVFYGKELSALFDIKKCSQLENTPFSNSVSLFLLLEE